MIRTSAYPPQLKLVPPMPWRKLFGIPIRAFNQDISAGLYLPLIVLILISMAEAQLKDFPNIFSLEGKVAVVTGGSRGLGLHGASGYEPDSFPLPSPC